jgi:hypothetical protein
MGKREQRDLASKLAKAEISHQKAERKVGKIRVRLARAEAKLARQADQLTAVRALTQPASTTPAATLTGPEVPSPNHKGDKKALAATTSAALMGAEAPTANQTTDNKAPAETPSASAGSPKADKKPAKGQERNAVRVNTTRAQVKSNRVVHAPMG